MTDDIDRQTEADFQQYLLPLMSAEWRMDSWGIYQGPLWPFCPINTLVWGVLVTGSLLQLLSSLAATMTPGASQKPQLLLAGSSSFETQG